MKWLDGTLFVSFGLAFVVVAWLVAAQRGIVASTLFWGVVGAWLALGITLLMLRTTPP